ncbi:Gfo/Idh/MocA family oxidoreductase [Streptomyces phaeochromogenes]|uniref:Gfo/Idh/MocA family oxidoreductase n=1 Tax=Streptomyces phaeochromogenes TaxID=1923 RepID=A0ABZ1HR87_STRPH|nr:Gfo/Idh/MocA family oxidoreductase [Streptomyces phaeochromogenes]WSD19748.1 Gfo/Idh/MocA family oxidoreductase [Streptomyces phaeochromogenes]
MSRTKNRPIGVGVIGAGPVVQAVHLPTLATLADRLTVTHVMDVDPEVAASVAARAGARHSTGLEELLADDNVDVVAVCSPHAFHAEHITAVVAAGKRGILCEKPLATTKAEAEHIAKAVSAAAVPIVVGAMHAYDPAWQAAQREWGDLPERVHLVRSRIYLPGNDEFIDLATDPMTAGTARPAAASGPPPTAAERIRNAVLGLATHTIPQLRQFLPGPVQVIEAHMLSPFGYRLVITGDGRTAELLALLPGAWEPDWTFEAWAPDARLRMTYPPSFVLAGSATSALTTESAGTRTWQFSVNGYQAEWLHLADVVEGRAEPLVGLSPAVADLVYALDLADGAAALLEDHG